MFLWELNWNFVCKIEWKIFEYLKYKFRNNKYLYLILIVFFFGKIRKIFDMIGRIKKKCKY